MGAEVDGERVDRFVINDADGSMHGHLGRGGRAGAEEGESRRGGNREPGPHEHFTLTSVTYCAPCWVIVMFMAKTPDAPAAIGFVRVPESKPW